MSSASEEEFADLSVLGKLPMYDRSLDRDFRLNPRLNMACLIGECGGIIQALDLLTRQYVTGLAQAAEPEELRSLREWLFDFSESTFTRGEATRYTGLAPEALDRALAHLERLDQIRPRDAAAHPGEFWVSGTLL
jgi:hypothetical protein